MINPFQYPSTVHSRRHGPRGYADYASFRPWLRDEFSFRCVYCLLREQWGRVRGMFDIDHFQPIAQHPDLAIDYNNLLYACVTCNAAKGSHAIPDPLMALTSATIRIGEDGRLKGDTPEAACLIDILGLNTDPSIEFRMLWIGIVALAISRVADLYKKLMGFPADVPDLRTLKPPGGNTRPEGLADSFHARRQRGELPATY